MRNRNQRYTSTPSTTSTPGPLRLMIEKIIRKRGPTEKEARELKRLRQIEKAERAASKGRQTLKKIDEMFAPLTNGLDSSGELLQ